MRQLPSLSDLHFDPQTAFKDDQFNLLMNQPVHSDWIKKHPLIKVKNQFGQMVPLEYLPIDKVEFMLTYIFQKYRIEVKEVQQLFQSIQVTVRVHYLHPISGEWEYHDGVGASPVQTDSGKSAADLSAIKSNAVMMAVPAAKSYAIKDACEHLGKLFGRDLNRKDIIEFSGAYSAETVLNESQPIQMSVASQQPVQYPQQQPVQYPQQQPVQYPQQQAVQYPQQQPVHFDPNTQPGFAPGFAPGFEYPNNQSNNFQPQFNPNEL